MRISRDLWRRRAPLITAVAVVALIGFASSASAQEDALAPINQATLADVERYLETRLTEVGRPGLAAAIVHDGEIVATIELGEASQGVPMTTDTPLFIASVSKSITAMALMQQVERGRVALDDPVTVHLPELAPEGDALTVRDLLHHRTGLTRYDGNEAWSGTMGSSLEANVSRLGPSLEPNASYAYSNANYDAIALIVQRASGRKFADYVAEEVFGPLDMDNSLVGPTEQPGIADGHYHWLFLGYRPFAQPAPAGMVGSATMFSSAEDLAHFVIAHLQDGVYKENRILSESSIEELHTSESFGIDLPDDYPVDAGYAGGLVVDASFPPDVDQSLARMVTLVHDGGALGYRAMMWMIPEVDLGFVALTNGNDAADESWLPQVSQGVKYILFDLDPPGIAVRSPFLHRYGKQLLLSLVTLQWVLAGLTVGAFRDHGRRWLNTTVFTVASLIDLTALVLILRVIPDTAEAPLSGVLQAPDYRILVLAMAAGVLWGVYRTYALLRKRTARLG